MLRINCFLIKRKILFGRPNTSWLEHEHLGVEQYRFASRARLIFGQFSPRLLPKRIPPTISYFFRIPTSTLPRYSNDVRRETKTREKMMSVLPRFPYRCDS